MAWPAFGGVQPGDPNRQGSLPEPGYREWKVDPRTEMFDDDRIPTEVTRVSDAGTFGVSSQHMRHQYAKVSPWNVDGSYAMLFAYGDRSSAVLVDGETFEFIHIIPNTYNGGRWSMQDPEIYHQRSGTAPELTATNVITGTTTVVRDFTPGGTSSWTLRPTTGARATNRSTETCGSYSCVTRPEGGSWRSTTAPPTR